MKLKQLSHKRAIRLAELAFAGRIEHPYVYWDDFDELLYVFVDKPTHYTYGRLDDEYFKMYGLNHVKERYDHMEIDSSFNVQIGGNNMCNIALIYALLFEWGVKVDFQGTGLFPESKYTPKTFRELETKKSENLK